MDKEKTVVFDPDPTDLKEKTVVFDPDATDLQMNAWSGIGVDKVQTTDLCSPIAAQLVVHNLQVALVQLKATKASETRLAHERGQIQEERENLRIEVARLQSGFHATFLEIPLSMLSGFAINMLSAEPQDGVGWFMLVLSVLMLLFLRGGQAIAALFKAIGKSKVK